MMIADERPARPKLRENIVTHLVAVLAAIVAAWIAVERISPTPANFYVAVMAGLVLFMMAIGWFTLGTVAGFVVNARNCVSLAKLQIAVWTVLAMSALAAGAAWNEWIGAAQPLDIVIPDGLLYALGISAASSVVAPSLLSIKGDKDPGQDDVNAAPDGRTRVGSLVARNKPVEARWGDVLRGDDLATAGQLDLSKLQQLLITLLLVVVYSVAVWNALVDVHAGYGVMAHSPAQWGHCQTIGFAKLPGQQVAPCDAAVIARLPDMDEKFVWLLAISHAGYLGSKVVNNKAPTPTTPALVAGAVGQAGQEGQPSPQGGDQQDDGN